MNTTEWLILVVAALILIAGVYFSFFYKKNDNEQVTMNKDKYQTVISLKIQACERLLLYLERMRFPVLVRRVLAPAMSRSDLHFALIQNVEDEFEHNLAQRLYVSEGSWHLVKMAKDEVLQSINTSFSEHPEADTAQMAQLLVSLSNPLIDNAVFNIKKEFNTF